MIRTSKARALFEYGQIAVGIVILIDLAVKHRWFTILVALLFVFGLPIVFMTVESLVTSGSVERIVHEQAIWQRIHADHYLTITKPCWMRDESVEQTIEKWETKAELLNEKN